MAKQPAKPRGLPMRVPARATPAAPARPAGDSSYRPLWISVAVGLFMILSLPAFIIMALGMTPTGVAYVIDRTKEKYGAFCVGSANFCGVFPFILEVWAGDHTPAQAFRILSNVFKLFIMYGAASFGWLLYAMIPPIVSAILVMVAQQRVAELRTIQEALINEWGPDAANPRPAPKAEAARPRTRRRR